MARILLIDDEVELSEMLRDWLADFEKHDVVMVHDGISGLTQLTGDHFHLAIVDWDLPGMSGPNIVRKFREQGGVTPVLLLTGRTTEDDKEAGFDAGADDYLTKPFSIKELGARIRSLLRRSAAPAAKSTGENQVMSSIRVCPACGRHYSHKQDTEVCPSDGTATVPICDKEVIGIVLSNTYQVDALLGVGAWSEVYKARNLQTGTSVAVKIMHPHLTGDPLKIKRFCREAETISKVQHESLAAVFDQGTLASGRPYLVMEYVEGKSLDKYLDERKRLSLRETQELFVPLCYGLAAAHKTGLIHRDLKPGNISVVRQEGKLKAKLLDFGLAKMVMTDNAALSSLTASGEVLGTPAYMSPEQCIGANIDHRSDLYALGCILYEVLTGKRAIPGKSSFEAMSNHISRYPDSMQDACPEAKVPERIESLIFRLMDKEPGERFAAADEFAVEFEKEIKKVPCP